MQVNHLRYIKVCYIQKYVKTRSTREKVKKKQKNVRVLAQGTFDLLHPGHLHYLRAAKKFGTHLTVIIARDDTVKRVKQRQTIFPENMRAQLVGALRVVDRVVLGGKGNILDRVVEINPDVIVLGYDQRISAGELKQKLLERGIKCKIVRASAHNPRTFKSTKLKNKIAQYYT